jgi:very-short-patch-repair endonuclease
VLREGCDHPPRNGEGDRAKRGGGGPAVLQSPIRLVKRARRLRQEMSPTEALLWTALRRRPGGFKFRRQFPLAPFALDFACLEARLAIEVDGEAHDRGDRPLRDERRDRLVAEKGFETLRFPASEVHRNLEGVVAAIVARCQMPGPLHRPSDGPPPRSGEEL